MIKFTSAFVFFLFSHPSRRDLIPGQRRWILFETHFAPLDRFLLKLRRVTKKKFPRRRFLACCGGVGVFWVSKSQTFAARFIRDRIYETGREIQTPKFKPTPAKWNQNRITTTWLGHSTVLINFYGVTILTDPVLFSRIGVGLGIGTLGPKRYIAPALTPKELPSIDVILLSHAHLDHMDLPTLQQFDASARVITAKNTADLLSGTGLGSAIELAWNEKSNLETPNGLVAIQAFEVTHWGGRWSKKETHRGWNGYVISREGRKIVFGGDTAKCESFRQLRSKGPIELGIMPIGAYNPWLHAHCTPEEAVDMCNDAGVRYILPIHHQAFALGREPLYEPVERFKMALQRESDRIALTDVGETFCLKG